MLFQAWLPQGKNCDELVQTIPYYVRIPLYMMPGIVPEMAEMVST